MNFFSILATLRAPCKHEAKRQPQLSSEKKVFNIEENCQKCQKNFLFSSWYPFPNIIIFTVTSIFNIDLYFQYRSVKIKDKYSNFSLIISVWHCFRKKKTKCKYAEEGRGRSTGIMAYPASPECGNCVIVFSDFFLFLRSGRLYGRLRPTAAPDHSCVGVCVFCCRSVGLLVYVCVRLDCVRFYIKCGITSNLPPSKYLPQRVACAVWLFCHFIYVGSVNWYIPRVCLCLCVFRFNLEDLRTVKRRTKCLCRQNLIFLELLHTKKYLKETYNDCALNIIFSRNSLHMCKLYFNHNRLQPSSSSISLKKSSHKTF